MNDLNHGRRTAISKRTILGITGLGLTALIGFVGWRVMDAQSTPRVNEGVYVSSQPQCEGMLELASASDNASEGLKASIAECHALGLVDSEATARFFVEASELGCAKEIADSETLDATLERQIRAGAKDERCSRKL